MGNYSNPESPSPKISQLYELTEELEVFWNVTRSIAETAKKLEEPFRAEQARFKTLELEVAHAKRLASEAQSKIIELQSALRAEHKIKQDLLTRINHESQARIQSEQLFTQEKKRTTHLLIRIDQLEKDLKAHQTLAREKSQELASLKGEIPKKNEEIENLKEAMTKLQGRAMELEKIQKDAQKESTHSTQNMQKVLEQLQHFKNLYAAAEAHRVHLSTQSQKTQNEYENLKQHFLIAKKNVEKLLLDRQMILKQLNGLRAEAEKATQATAQQKIVESAPQDTKVVAESTRPKRSSALFKRGKGNASPPPFRSRAKSTNG